MSKIIAVYGSPGSGKSAFSVALAAQLSKRSNVVLLSTNRVVPMLKVLVPSAQIDRSMSVGTLFTSLDVTQEAVCKRIVFLPKNNKLGFMGLATGDTPNTYNGIYTAAKIQSLYGILLTLTDYLVVDCTSHISPAHDPLGSAAMANAAHVLQLLTPDIIGIEYRSAILPLAKELIQDREPITILGPCSPVSPVEQVQSILQIPVKYHLPQSAEIADFFLSGQFSKAHTKEGREYEQEIKAIAKEVIQENE